MTLNDSRVERLADADGLRLERIGIPVFEVINQLLLACVNIVLEANKLLLETLQLAEVISVVALQVFDFLEHHKFFLIDDILMLHVLAIERIKAHFVAQRLALHFALLFFLLKLLIENVHTTLDGIDVLREVLGLQSLLSHVIA